MSVTAWFMVEEFQDILSLYYVGRISKFILHRVITFVHVLILQSLEKTL